MHDIKLIRDDPAGFDEGLKRRGLAPLSAEVLKRNAELRMVLARLQQLQARRNEVSKLIGHAKAKKDEAQASVLINEVAGLKEKIQEGEEEQRRLEAALNDFLATIPNIPAADVPVGPDETANVEIHRWSKKPAMSFTPKEHFELGEALHGMDFETAARMSGARFVVLTGHLARLERAIAHFMLDLHTEQARENNLDEKLRIGGYTEVSPPYLVRDQAVFGTSQLPKFADDLFRTGNGYWLIPTAEVSLTNLVREQILSEADLPLRFTAYTPCFRAEAGAAGKDTRGMIRMHQFSKVELVSITTPENSAEEHERMTHCAQEVLKRLGLHHRVVMLSTGDTGFGAQKTYDIEVWLPGQAAFREISSCSNCGDFQARRMNARYRPENGKSPRFVHTLNGSGLAVGRTLVAILENYQQADGSILVPEVLKSYMGGMERIDP